MISLSQQIIRLCDSFSLGCLQGSSGVLLLRQGSSPKRGCLNLCTLCMHSLSQQIIRLGSSFSLGRLQGSSGFLLLRCLSLGTLFRLFAVSRLLAMVPLTATLLLSQEPLMRPLPMPLRQPTCG